MSKPALLLVVCGAPLASRLGDGVRAAHDRGWDPYIIPTDAALPWLAEQDLADVPVIVGNRKPGEPRRTPAADAVAVVPTTFHIPSGTGGRIVKDFRWDWVFERIKSGPDDKGASGRP